MRAIIRYTDPEGRSLDLIREVRRTIHNKMPADYKGPDVPDVVQKVLFTREEIIDDDGKKFFTEWHADDPLWPEYDPSNEVPGFKPDTDLIVSKKVTPDTESETFTVDYTRVGSTDSDDQTVNESQEDSEDYTSKEENNSTYDSVTPAEIVSDRNSKLNEKEVKSSSASSEGLKSAAKEQGGSGFDPSNADRSSAASNFNNGSKSNGSGFNKILADQLAQAAVEKTEVNGGMSTSTADNVAKEDTNSTSVSTRSQENAVKYSEGSAVRELNEERLNSSAAETNSNGSTSEYGSRQEQTESGSNGLEQPGQNMPESRVVTNSRVVQLKSSNDNSSTTSSTGSAGQLEKPSSDAQVGRGNGYGTESEYGQGGDHQAENAAPQGYQGSTSQHQAQAIGNQSRNIYKPTVNTSQDSFSENTVPQENSLEVSAKSNSTNANENTSDASNGQTRLGNSSASQIRDYTPFVGSAARMHEDETPADKDPRLFNEGEDVSDQYVTTKINGEEVVLSKAPVAAPANKMQPEPEEFVKPYKVPRHARLIPLSPKFSYLRQDKMTAAMLRKLEIIGYFYFEDNEWKSVEFDDSLLLEATLNNPL